MSALDPHARKLTSGKILLTWTPDPSCFGYRFYRDGKGVSRSTNPGQVSTTFAAETDGKPHTYGIARAIEQAAETVTFPAVDPPPSSGTVRDAGPGQVGAALAASKPGDTVVATGLEHPKLVLSKSFDEPRVTLKCDEPTWFAGIDTNGQSGYIFDPSVVSHLPVSLTDYNITPFFIRGASARLRIGGTYFGGYDAIKQYGAARDIEVAGGCSVFGFGGDGIHVNGGWVRLIDYWAHDPIDKGDEHHDGAQIQFGKLYLGPKVRIGPFVCNPRRDEPNNGTFARQEASGPVEIEVDGTFFDRWQGGRALQALDCDITIIRKPRFVDCGAANSPNITLSGSKPMHLYGVPKSDVYVVGGSNVVWHP